MTQQHLTIIAITLDFNWLLKYGFECSFVTSECSLQCFGILFEVHSDYLRYDPINLDHRTYLSEQTSKQTLDKHSELTNKHSTSSFKGKLKSGVTTKTVLY